MEKNVKIKFKRKSISCDENYNPLYINALIIMILKLCSNKERASLIKLNLMVSIFLYENEYLDLNRLTEDKKYFYLWEPKDYVTKSVNYGITEELIIFNSGYYYITKKGLELFLYIQRDNDIFMFEKHMCNSLKRRITESKIKLAIKKWSEKNV